jgi:hypothetical protein
VISVAVLVIGGKNDEFFAISGEVESASSSDGTECSCFVVEKGVGVLILYFMPVAEVVRTCYSTGDIRQLAGVLLILAHSYDRPDQVSKNTSI